MVKILIAVGAFVLFLRLLSTTANSRDNDCVLKALKGTNGGLATSLAIMDCNKKIPNH